MNGNASGSRLVPRLFVAAAALLFTIFLLEVFVRITGLQGDAFYRPDRYAGWVHRLGIHGRYVSPRARAPVVINRLGLMGPETTLEKPPGVRRLLLLGDSFTESMQVPWTDSWANRLRDALGPGWEVLNAGVAGYGTDNALLWFDRYGRTFLPDVVLLMVFTGNDVSDNDRSLSLRIGGVEPKPFFEIEGDSIRLVNYPLPPEPTGPVPSFKRFLSEHSRLYLFVRTRRNQIAGLRRQTDATEDRVPLAWHVYARETTPEWDHAWTLTDRLIRRLDGACRDAGAPLRVASLPTGWRVEPEQRREVEERYAALRDTTAWDLDLPDRRLGAIAATLGVPFLSLTDTLLATRAAAPAPLYGDHLTKAGHDVVGAALAAFLNREMGENPASRNVQR